MITALFTRWRRFCLAFFTIFCFSFFSVSASPSYASVNTTWPVFLFIVILALVLVFLGIIARSPLLPTIGLVLFIIAGFLMLQGQVMIPTGSVENVTGNVTTITDTYEIWDDGNNEFVGFYVVVAGMVLLFTLGSAYLGDDRDG